MGDLLEFVSSLPHLLMGHKDVSVSSLVEDMPVQGEPLAVELVNTTFVKGGLRGHVVDVLTCPEELLAWLRSRSWDLGPNVVEGLAGKGVSDADVDHFRQLRQALRDLFTAETATATGTATWPDHAIQIVNNAVRGATQWRELSTAAPERSVTVWSSPDWAVAALSHVAASGVALLSGQQRSLLRACRAPGCILFFVQNHARREWCSAECGNRARVARHSRRHRDGSS